MQLSLFSQTAIIKTGAICSECKPERARRVVDALNKAGWLAEYGGEGHGSVLPPSPEFADAFYAAIDAVDRGG